ncbi:MAG: TIGR00266 family protein [Oscillospiraceae bacterium]|nr:TIGR00266 family protein [Oscillospiraceae bacterium]
MKYEIVGGAFPVAIFHLDSGESLVTETGAMAWMSPDFELDVRGESFRRAMGRAITGASLFRDVYTALDDGLIALQPQNPGRIIELDITPEKSIVLQKSAFLASEPTVDLSVYLNDRISTGIFGGEGFFLQKLSGEGKAFAAVYGEMVEYDLEEGQRMLVDTGNVLGFEDTVDMSIESVPGLKNKLLSGRGFFNTVLTGPGKIMLQTLTPKHFKISGSSSSGGSAPSSEASSASTPAPSVE